MWPLTGQSLFALSACGLCFTAPNPHHHHTSQKPSESETLIPWSLPFSHSLATARLKLTHWSRPFLELQAQVDYLTLLASNPWFESRPGGPPRIGRHHGWSLAWPQGEDAKRPFPSRVSISLRRTHSSHSLYWAARHCSTSSSNLENVREESEARAASFPSHRAPPASRISPPTSRTSWSGTHACPADPKLLLHRPLWFQPLLDLPQPLEHSPRCPSGLGPLCGAGSPAFFHVQLEASRTNSL